MNKKWPLSFEKSIVRNILLFIFSVQVMLPLAAKSQTPAFEMNVISGYDSTSFISNAYPVIARLKSGRLLCVFAVLPAKIAVKKLSLASATSDDGGRTWTKPVLLFDNESTSHSDPSIVVDDNKVLVYSTSVTFPKPAKIDSTFIDMRSSTDGQNWSKEVFIKKTHRYICGKIHQGHRLKNGTLIMGYSWETWAEQRTPATTEGEMNLKSGVLRSKDGGNTWVPGEDMYADVQRISPSATSGLGEPATVVLQDGRIMALMRAGGSKLYQAWSRDGGLTWTTPLPSKLTAHNSPASLWRLDNSADVLAIWSNAPDNRNTLAAALSADGGKTWSTPKTIAKADGFQVSYPSAVQSNDGTLIAVWQQDIGKGRREVKIARFNRDWLLNKK